MSSRRFRLSAFAPGFALAFFSALTLLAGTALADEPKPRALQRFQKSDVTTEYTAPLSQATQPSYVPQSVALSGPPTLSYQDGEPVPPGYTPVERRRRGAIIGGAVLLGSLYLMSSLAAAVSADASEGRKNDLGGLWMPGVGPFIAMADAKRSATGNYFLAIDGLGQIAGATLLIYGLASPKTVLVRNDLTSAKPKVRPVPLATGHGAGVGLVGTF